MKIDLSKPIRFAAIKKPLSRDQRIARGVFSARMNESSNRSIMKTLAYHTGLIVR